LTPGTTAFESRAIRRWREYKDLVTGSLNTSLGQWLIGAGLANSSYVAAQGRSHSERCRLALVSGFRLSDCLE